MREILFRGNQVNDGMWIQGYLFQCWGRAYILWGMTNDTPTMHEVRPETVGQFTGLYAGVFNSLCGDKEYDEIYEGDKISVTYATQGMRNSHEHTITGVVAFKDGSFVVEWDFPKKGKYKHQTLNSIKRLGDCGVVIKIIGNIHDNPELLK